MCISEGFVKIILRYWLYVHKNNAIWCRSQAFHVFEIKQYIFNLATKQFLWGELEAARPDSQQTCSLCPSAHLHPHCINFVSFPLHGQHPCKARSGRCGWASEYQLPRETIMFAQSGHEFSSHSSIIMSVLTDLVGAWLFLRILSFCPSVKSEQNSSRRFKSSWRETCSQTEKQHGHISKVQMKKQIEKLKSCPQWGKKPHNSKSFRKGLKLKMSLSSCVSIWEIESGNRKLYKLLSIHWQDLETYGMKNLRSS